MLSVIRLFDGGEDRYGQNGKVTLPLLGYG